MRRLVARSFRGRSVFLVLSVVALAAMLRAHRRAAVGEWPEPRHELEPEVIDVKQYVVLTLQEGQMVALARSSGTGPSAR